MKYIQLFDAAGKFIISLNEEKLGRHQGIEFQNAKRSPYKLLKIQDL